MRHATLFTLALCAVLWVVIPAGCGCDDDAQSESDIAKALADKLTGSLGFTGGEEVEGAPPAEHVDDSAYPQVTELQAPATLAGGQPFTVSMHTSFSKPADVKGAIVYVDKASKYVKVASTVDPDLLVLRISGALKDDPDLQGKSFSIKVAMYDGAVAVGNYQTWALEIGTPGETAATTQQLQDALAPAGGSTGSSKQGNLPAYSGTGAPEDVTIEAPTTVGADAEFAVTAMFTSLQPVSFFLIQVDNSTEYLQFEVQDTTGSPGIPRSVSVSLKFDAAAVDKTTGALSSVRKALSALGTDRSAAVTTSIKLTGALAVGDPAKGGLVSKPAEKSLVYTSENRKCEGDGCGGVAKECKCGNPGVTWGFEPAACIEPQCSGWMSIVCQSVYGTDQVKYQECERTQEPVNKAYPSGTQFCAFECCMTLTCGGGGGTDGGTPDAAIIIDAGSDAGPQPVDAGSDAGQPTDAGSDGGTPDAGAGNCIQCSPNNAKWVGTVPAQVTVIVMEPPETTCSVLGGYSTGDTLVLDDIGDPTYSGSFGSGWTGISASAGTIDVGMWSGIPKDTVVTVTLQSRTGQEVTITLTAGAGGVTVTQVCYGPAA